MNNLLRRISDLKVSIFLLTLLIFSSFLGTLLDQSAFSSVKPSTNFVLSQENLANFFGFSHIFTTSWFFFLNFLIAISLITCTTTQQLPSFDFCRSISFFKTFLEKEKFHTKVITSKIWISHIVFKLLNQNYIVFQKKNSFYASKGLIARIGPFFVHLSLLFIFFGSFLSAFSGFNAQEFVPKGELIYLTNFPDFNFFDHLPLNSLRINDFWISHLKNESIYQFYTNLSHLDAFGIEKSFFTISVNHPYQDHLVLWYQTDWDIIGLKWQINDLSYQIPVNRLSLGDRKLWISWLPFHNPLSPIFFENLRGEIVFLGKMATTNFSLEMGQFLGDSKFYFKFLDILSCTGLQIHYEPGNFFLCFGFLNLIISTFLSFLSYNRIWILKKRKLVVIGGLTNRAKLSFEFHFLKLFDFLTLKN